MTDEKVLKVYEMLRDNKVAYHEKYHCSLLLEVMGDVEQGTVSHFCKKALIGESKFYKWIRTHELFAACYDLGKMYARVAWEELGKEIRDEFVPPGASSYKFEYWRMIGWSRFGISKNAKVRLNLDPEGTPHKHYKQLIDQASTGDFTAGEIKQLMEAINVGLNSHQIFELQKQIDQLHSDLEIMSKNHGDNTVPNKQP